MTHPQRCIHSGLCRLGAPEDGDCFGDFPIKCPDYCASHSSAPVPEGYIITEELVKDIENGFRFGVEGTVPTSNELVDALRSRPYNEQSIRQDATEKVLDELRIIKEYDIIRFHQKHTLPKSWVEVRVTGVSKDGKRIGISGKMPGERCTTEMCIDLSDVRYVGRWIELRKQEEK